MNYSNHRKFITSILNNLKYNRKLCIQSQSLELESQVRKSLRSVIEPISNQPILSLGCVKRIEIIEESFVKLYLETWVPGYPYSYDILTKCDHEISKLLWVRRVEIKQSNSFGLNSKQSSVSGISKIKHVIAVSSCKGGVGKSTVAVNLALSLVKKGLSVGILDADVFGPSLPAMIPVHSKVIKRSPDNDKFILPLEGPLGIKVLSFGFVNPKAGAPGAGGKDAALMRGPVVSKVINQLLNSTDWGALDYLIIDMPPGTSDIQITIGQCVSLSGAVIVTTPHTLSLIDASKGIKMFRDLRVPILAVVENMAYFTCDAGKVYYPFGRGGKEEILKSLRLHDSSEVDNDLLSTTPFHFFPILPSISESVIRFNNTVTSIMKSSTESSAVLNTEEFLPYALRFPMSETSMKYHTLSDDVISEIFKIQMAAILTPVISYKKHRGIVLRYYEADGANEFVIPVEQLRIRSPITGKIINLELIDRYKHSELIKFDLKGNYGVSFQWNDGHFADIYPYAVLREIAQDVIQTS